MTQRELPIILPQTDTDITYKVWYFLDIIGETLIIIGRANTKMICRSQTKRTGLFHKTCIASHFGVEMRPLYRVEMATLPLITPAIYHNKYSISKVWLAASKLRSTPDYDRAARRNAIPANKTRISPPFNTRCSHGYPNKLPFVFDGHSTISRNCGFPLIRKAVTH